MKKFLYSILFLIIGFILGTQQSLAYGIFTGSQTGYDISYPQGNISSLPSAYNFLVVGTTNGRAYTDNPYLSSQAALASGKTLSLYMNLNAPVGSTVKGNTSSPKPCSKGDKLCQAYNYGYNAAVHSYAYAQSKGATSTMWWLDVEVGNSWSSNQSINDATIQGATDYFNFRGATAGIYSTSGSWSTIAGNSFAPVQTTTNVVPNWVPGASATNPQASCTPFTTNGQAWLTQYVSGGLDNDFACN